MNNPTPKALKALRGTTRADRANPHEPQSPTLQVGTKPPTWVKGGSARRTWRSLIEVAPPGLITQMDTVALGLLVVAFGDWLAARQVLETEGRYYRTVGRDGAEMVRAHPAGDDEADAWRRVRLVLKDFGLDPADRARVSTGSLADADPVEAFLRRRIG